MRLALHSGDATRSGAAVHVRKSGVTRSAERAWIRTEDGVKLFYASLGGSGTSGITVYPIQVFGGTIRDVAAPVTTAQTTVTVTGGIAPYTYSWVYVSGDVSPAPTDPASATTSFTDNLGPGESSSAVFKCTVTDAAGLSADSPTATAHLQNMGDTL